MGLPNPLGPFQVAFGDFELQLPAKQEAGKWEQESTKTAEVPLLEGLPLPPLVRIYYPTAEAPPKCLTAGRYWLPHVKYMFGYCSLAMPPLDWCSNLKCWMAAVLSFCFVNPKAVIRASIGTPPLLMVDRAAGVEKDGKMPVVIFSHGLWAMRTTYSTYCCDLASYGYVVVAMEHRDRSASMTKSTLPDGRVKWLGHQPLGVDMGDVSTDIREQQLRQRVNEIQSIRYILEEMTAGNVPDSANATRGPARLKPSMFAGRLDVREVAIAGHSFGGVTASLTTDIDQKVKCCIALDAWWTPMMKAGMDGTGGNRPLLLVNNSNFNGPELQVARTEYLARRKAAHPNAATDLLVIQGSCHQDQSDLPLILPNFSQRSGTSGPLGGFKTRCITSRASVEFLYKHFICPGRGDSFEAEMTDEDKSHIVVEKI